jgi:hypothetical protein
MESGRRTSPARVFVGRGPELDALAATRPREPQVVLVRGEAGIGKSSRIVEFPGRKQGLPAIVASGDTAEAVLLYGVVQQLAAGVAAVSPSVLAGLELLSQGPGPDPLAGGVELRALISSGSAAFRGRGRRRSWTWEGSRAGRDS